MEIQDKLIHEQHRSNTLLAEKKDKDLKILQRDNILKQNEMQINIKKEKDKAEKEKNFALEKMVLD